MVVVPIGFGQRAGVLAAGSRQAAFPSEEDRLFLTVGANQTAAMLQRLHAELVLRESEERFRGTFENAAVGIAHVAIDGRWLSVNRTLCNLLGYTREELLEPTWIDITHPDDRAAGRELADKLLRGELPRDSLDKRLVRKDGTILWATVTRSVQRTAEGRPDYFIAFIQDISERKRLEQALIQANARLDLAIRGSNVGIWEVNMPDGDYAKGVGHWINVWEQLGFEPPEDRSPFSVWQEFLHPDDKQRILRAVYAYLDGETKEYEVEYRIRHKDGSYRWMLARGTAIREERGRPIRFIGSRVDITELKRVEEALGASEAWFRFMANTMPQIVWTARPDGSPEYLNDRFVEYTGVPVAELTGERWLSVLHPDDRERTMTRWMADVANGSDHDIEFRLRASDGRDRWFKSRALPVRDESGQVVKWLGTITDIDDQKRAEEEETKRARLAELGRDVGLALTRGDSLRGILQPCAEALVQHLDAAFARIWTLGPGEDTLVLQASAGLSTRIDGSNSRVPVGRLKIGLIAQERRPHLTNDLLGDARISDPEWARSEGMVGFAGYPLVVEDRLRGVLAIFSRGPLAEAVIQALGSVADVIALGIERKIQEDELRRAKEAAEAASRFKSEFLANVSHEIRTPMNAILGMTELAIETPGSEEQKQYLTIVKSSADALLNVINDLLDFSKIEAGRLELDPAGFSLRSVLGEALRALALRAHRKGLELVCQIQPDVLDGLIGDAGRLRQILLNLVGNAIKFTEEGEVVIRIETVPDGTAERPDSAGGESVPSQMLRFSVSDTGIGIPLDKQQKIFQAFEQEDNSTTRRYGGTGLGLSIATRLVTLMHGAIGVESEPCHGSTFHFTARFGLRPDQPDQPWVRPLVELQGLRVLVVDDNATNRHILEEWFRAWRTEPTVVADGLEALDALWRASASGRPFPLVVLDARMPGIDGLVLAERILQSPEHSATRIILLTSDDLHGEVGRFRELGIAAYAMKPVQQEELLEIIYRVLSRPVPIEATTDRTALPSEDDGQSVTPAEPAASAHGLRILLAEDNILNQQLVDHLLRRRGHDVIIARDGRKALEALDHSSFDLMLLDIQMPEFDGFQVIEALRRREQEVGGHLPVVALTAHSMKGDRERCLRVGMDEYLSKPIRAAELFAVIDRVLAGLPATATPVASSAAPGTMVDAETLLAACDDDPVLLDKLIRVFQGSVPGSLARVQEAIARQDSVELRETAHQLRGLLSTFSSAAAQVAGLLEAIGAGGELGDAESRFESLAALIEQLAADLENLRIDELRLRSRRPQE